MPDPSTRPVAPDIPEYLLDALDAREPEELREIAEYADQLAAFYAHQRDQELERRRREESVDRDDVREAGYSTDPDDYDVPASAYITIKEPHQGKKYYYWQWRSGSNSWKNKYIGPVE